MSKSAAVVIPHYDDFERLRRCLDALMPQVGSETEVIVADNGSAGSFDAILAAHPGVRIVHQPEKGAGPARNAGAAATSATWLFFLDADCVPAPDWLATARRLADAGMVFGGEVTLFDETPAPRSGAEAFETVFAFHIRDYLETKGFLPSCQLVMARRTFETVGGFRNALSEDVDWSRRAAAAGYRLAMDEALRIAHPTRSDWPALRKKWLRLTREGFETDVQGRGLGARLRWMLRAAAMPASAIAHAPRLLRDSRLTARERRRGLATLWRIRLLRMRWMMAQALGAPAA